MSVTHVQENGTRKLAPVSGSSFLTARLPLREIEINMADEKRPKKMRSLRLVLLLQLITTVVKWWRFGEVGSDVGRINEVTLRRARLVLGWVTVSGFNSRCGKFISV